jgi:hypothetical protein
MPSGIHEKSGTLHGSNNTALIGVVKSVKTLTTLDSMNSEHQSILGIQKKLLPIA